MQSLVISSLRQNITGEIILSGSKSISNRVLLIRSLCKEHFEIYNLSDSDDTTTLDNLLKSGASTLDAHHAGTTFRFLTAFLALQPETQILTGSERMKQRPIKALVDALNELGAHITYVENEGFPPLAIHRPAAEWKREISLPANISSQYITALLLIAPTLPNGLTIHLEGDIVSKPYIEMTLGIMHFFGIETSWENQTISINHQLYQAKDYHVEADWSSASYFYAIAGLSDTADITLKGLHQNSLQGDAEIAKIAEKFGIITSFEPYQIKITKSKGVIAPVIFEYDFVKVPDIAQSISVLCAGLGTQGLFSGLQTLKIKETDRIAALQNELTKMHVFMSKMPAKFSQKTGIEYYLQEGKSISPNDEIPTIDTYNDHRMAMAFAPLALIFPIRINEPKVVSKSYPNFWKDLATLGFDVQEA